MANKKRADRSLIFSTPEQMRQIAQLVQNYLLLPFSSFNVPGSILEQTIARVRGGKALGKYDFVDVVDSTNGIGWQVKSTMHNTPVTWKRAKIKDRNTLITASEKSEAGRRELGNAIISFCNLHAQKSLTSHSLSEIGYARLIVRRDGTATYFERLLCTSTNPLVFNPEEFIWKWSTEKNAKKEQLSAFHATHAKSEAKWFAWHGRGENQLHFSGESTWWPDQKGTNHINFKLPLAKHRLSIEKLHEVLADSRKQAGLKD